MEQDLATLQIISDTLKNEPKASQRKLAETAGMSIGLMNAVLQRFVERGWIMLSNVNGRKLAYALTHEGMQELAARGRKFAARTFKIASTYNDLLIDVVKKAKDSGKTKVVLYGNSYIKFMIGYACHEVGMDFEEKNVNEEMSPASLCLAGELVDSEKMETLVKYGCQSLVEIVQGN